MNEEKTEIVKLHMSPQGMRVKAYTKSWLIQLGFSAEEQAQPDIYVKATLSGNKITLEKYSTPAKEEAVAQSTASPTPIQKPNYPQKNKAPAEVSDHLSVSSQPIN